MKPFDLEAAKAGAEMFTAGGTVCKFIGFHSDGSVVAESLHGGWLISAHPENLYMIEEKKKYYVCVYRHVLSGSISVGEVIMEKPTYGQKSHHEYIKTIEFEV